MTALCSLQDIPDGDAIGVSSSLGEMLIYRSGREVFAYTNHCPHLGIELNFQPDVFLDGDKRYIQCANHGALFELESGACVFGPCQGENLTAVSVTVADDKVYLKEVA
jgi:nitrite reductase/ring-hydroxylating ferredoxin subunit